MTPRAVTEAQKCTATPDSLRCSAIRGKFLESQICEVVTHCSGSIKEADTTSQVHLKIMIHVSGRKPEGLREYFSIC